ncbi:MAG: TldD/PmbA family protein [Promethearchaeota archaeon]
MNAHDISYKVKAEVADYEVYFQRCVINELEIQKNVPIFVNKADTAGYGIRILEKGGLGFSSSDDLSDSAIQRAIGDALHSAKLTEPVTFAFPQKKSFKTVKTTDLSIKGDAEGAITSYAEQFLDEVPSNVLIAFGKIRSYYSQIELINSEGLDLQRDESYFMVEASIVSKDDKKVVEYWPHEYRRRIEDLPPTLLNKWAEKAHDQLIAREPASMTCEIIFSPRSVLDGLGPVIAFHASGKAKVNGVSKFSLGETVASRDLTARSNGLYSFGLMSSGFDDEGIPQENHSLISNGVFTKYIYDQFYGMRKDETESTGNGLRQIDTTIKSKYALIPNNTVSNFHIEPGNKDLEQLIEEIDHGVLVESFSWLLPDKTTGSFSSEIRAAYSIENGEIKTPLKGGLVYGNFFDLIKNVSGVSRTAEITSGGSMLAGVCPYIRFENVNIAGV